MRRPPRPAGSPGVGVPGRTVRPWVTARLFRAYELWRLGRAARFKLSPVVFHALIFECRPGERPFEHGELSKLRPGYAVGRESWPAYSSLVADVVDDNDRPAVIGELLDGISVVPIGADRFRGPAPARFFGDRVFGGVIVAQALRAAVQTVDAGIRPHSLHEYFMRAARPGHPVEITVDRLRDGRTFSTRHAVMRQGDRIVFWMTCSFHAEEPGEEYQFAMPDDLMAPEELSQSPFAPGPFLVRDIGATLRPPTAR